MDVYILCANAETLVMHGLGPGRPKSDESGEFPGRPESGSGSRRTRTHIKVILRGIFLEASKTNMSVFVVVVKKAALSL